MSEIHLGCPPNTSGPQISYFTIAIPSQPPENSILLRVQHNITSSLPRVGLQVWKAELALADFLLYKMIDSSDYHGIIAVEIGCGTGLAGMILAIGANTVFLTDHGDEVLGNCAKNVHLNHGIFHSRASLYVRELDWTRPWPPETAVNTQSPQRYTWNTGDIEKLQKASLLLAADVIYCDDLTDAFFSVLESIMSTSPEKVLYLALEKRYNFSMDDLDVVANGYSNFLGHIQVDAVDHRPPPGFVGRVVNLDGIPQYVVDYDRGSDVEIWEIRYV
ncbi:hypothetical protein M569_06593, partial [Genlisea aurea]